MTTNLHDKREEITLPVSKESFPLPEKPVYTNREKPSLLNTIKELWQYRELCYFFCWRDLTVRYRQTILGVMWVIIQPLVSMLIFSYFFGSLAKFSSNGMPYSIFYFAGLLPWIFFSNTINNCSNSLNSDRSLITKIYFPRMLVPAATMLAGFVDMLIALGLLLILVLAQGFWPTIYLLALPPIIMLTSIFTFSIGLILAALNLRYRDVKLALPFIIQLLFFINPILFPLNIIPAKQQLIIILINPLSICIESLRESLIGHPLDWLALGLGAISIFIYLIICSLLFKKLERTFAEKI